MYCRNCIEMYFRLLFSNFHSTQIRFSFNTAIQERKKNGKVEIYYIKRILLYKIKIGLQSLIHYVCMLNYLFIYFICFYNYDFKQKFTVFTPLIYTLFDAQEFLKYKLIL